MRKISFLVLSAAILLVAGCGKKAGKTGLLVPKDAIIVLHINTASLSSKLTWDEIKQTDWFKQLSEKSEDPFSKQLLADPATSGIDAKGDIVFYLKKQGRGSYIVFEGSLADAAKFETTLKEIKKKNGDESAETRTDGEFKYLTSEREGLVLWNTSKFALLASVPMPGISNMWGSRNTEGVEFPSDSLVVFGKNALTLKPENNLDGDSRFADLVKDGGDVHLWTNAEAYMTDMGPMMSLMKFNVLFQGNVSATSLSFNNGQIVAKSKGYYNEEMRKLISKYEPGNINADAINRIPGNVSAVLAFNCKPEGLTAFLKTIGVDGVVNSALAELNFSMDEFVKAIKGDVILSLSDLAMVTKQDTIEYGEGMDPYIYSSEKPDMKVLFATSVGDKASFEKMVTLAWQAAKGKTDELPPITYKLEDKWFALSNSAEQTNSFLAGTASGKKAFTDKITGHPFGMYVDLQKIIRALGEPSAKDEDSKQALDLTLKMWQDVVVTGGEYKNKAVDFSFEVNLADKSTNSLKQLNQYFSKLAAIEKNKSERFDPVVADSAVAAPAPAPPAR